MAAKKSPAGKIVKKKPTRSHNLRRPKPAPEPPLPAQPEPVLPSVKKNGFYVVGIGASAGGLEAFEQFFSNMPADSGMAFVLVPHLSPEHKSLMAELLKRYTAMEIFEAREGMVVKPNHVYIIPPNRDLAINQGALLLRVPTEQRGVRHPIDYFFRSLAQDQADRSICVILSGTGTEGALGLRAVKGEGGLVLAQDVKDAKYDGMPASAIATGLVDHVLPAARMPELLLRYTRISSTRLTPPAVRLEEPVEALQKIHTLVKAKTGHDFTLYKQNTVIRRAHKRMALHQIESLDDYVVYLRNNPHEINSLFNELLIRVTSFFRDPEAFDILKSRALPHLLDKEHKTNSMRIWVPGCSTGEEAYSLAILCDEYLREHQNGRREIQIFATDIDMGAIDIARAGTYPESIAVDVSAERLNRYFVKRSGTYKIKEELRESVVFANQDLIKDPPFSRMDLISCRNVLIYMGAALQKRVLSIFHYALNPDGVLFLGSSETVGDSSDRYSIMDKRWKIFRSRHVDMLPVAAIELHPPFERAGSARMAVIAKAVRPPSENIGDVTERMLLERYSPPCVVVNDKGDILYFHGKTGKYLEPASGKAALNVVEMARDGIRLEVRTGLRKVVTRKKDVLYEGLQVRTNGGYQPVNLEIRYITRPEHLEGLVMFVFNEVPAAPGEKATKAKILSREKTTEKLSAMEYALKSTQEHLQTTIEELETSNEELKSTNEELQSSNEELQSTNEELETSREELQSSNEELLTVNTELQHKIEELSEANGDIVNLLASTQVATIFLSYELRIRRFTPSAADVINILQTDVGRPLSDLSLKLDYPKLAADIDEVLRTLTQKERTVQHQEGRWYLVRMAPYRTTDNVIDGVVVTFVDITEQKRAQLLEASLAGLRGIVDTVREPFLVLDRTLLVLSANRAFYDYFRTTAEETEKRHFFELGNGQWNIPALKKLLDDVLASSTTFENYPVEHDFPQIGHKKMLLNARRIHQEGLETETVLLAIGDASGEK